MVLEPILTLSPDREQALSAGAYSSASHRFCGAASTALRQSEILTGLPCFAVPESLSQEGLVGLQIHYKRFGPLPFVFLRMAGFLGHVGKLAVKAPTSYVRFRTKTSRGRFTRC